MNNLTKLEEIALSMYHRDDSNGSFYNSFQAAQAFCDYSHSIGADKPNLFTEEELKQIESAVAHAYIYYLHEGSEVVSGIYHALLNKIQGIRQ